MKVLIIGMDGCSLDLIELWRDELPKFRKIIENGVFGKRESSKIFNGL